MKNKLHKVIAKGIIKTLEAVFFQNVYADKAIERVFKENKQWGARDRKLVAETVYDITRWKKKFAYMAGISENDVWGLFYVWLKLSEYEIPDWDELMKYDEKPLKEITAETPPEVVHSFSHWMYAKLKEELGEQCDKEVGALNQKAPIVIRVNTLKTDKQSLINELSKEGVVCGAIDHYETALLMHGKKQLFSLDSFKKGLYEVQDASSQLVAELLDPKPGERVVDACAGAGGKTLHLAALMKNKGKIIAMDVEQWKLNELKKRAARAGAFCIESRVIESGKSLKRLHNSVDKLLIDAPCSGLGVLKRNPDAKWKLSLEFINKVKNIQLEILNEYSKLLKPGGVMVYATCSILPSENELQVEKFIAANKDEFEVVADKHCWPSEGYDGFYMCKIARKKQHNT